MSTDSTPNLLVLVGHGSDDDHFEELDALGQVVTQRLGLPTQSALLESANVSIGERLLSGIIAYDPLHVIVLPLFVGAATSRHNTIRQIIEAAQDRWPEIAMAYGQSLAAHNGVIAAYSQLVEEMHPDASTKTAFLLIGRGSRDADSNTEAAIAARLIAEESAYVFTTVETAFYERAKPDIAAGLKRCAEAGAEQIIVVPYLLYENALYQAIHQQVESYQTQLPLIQIRMASHLGLHEGIIDAICQRYNEALTSLVQRENSGLPRSHGHTHGPQGHQTAQVSALESLLPPRYQGDATVSAAPMEAADLIYDAQGQVAWDEIWGDFCDLALAGGPPHRGTLLEPVSPEAAAADPEGYQRVLSELARGITLVTQLPTLTNAAPGWIGVQCTDEPMALWLLRAIIVENVSVRREGSVLYLPAGPQFRLEHEIKNVITVIAKTHHYWTEHLIEQTRQKETSS